MRRTLAVVALAATMIAPAAALAAPAAGPAATTNASCNNGKGGNGGEYNGKGNSLKAADCRRPAVVVTTPPASGDTTSPEDTTSPGDTTSSGDTTSPPAEPELFDPA